MQDHVPEQIDTAPPRSWRRYLWIAALALFAWDYWSLRERVDDAESDVVNAWSVADAAGRQIRKLESELEEVNGKIQTLEQITRRLRYQ
jgi:TolA-binding protein